jgi:LTXXQ motif family protein
MKRILLCALTAVAISVSAFSLNTAMAADDQSSEAAHKARMQRWAADHEAMMDARLGGMKAALKLTPDQNPLWEAFESAVRGGAKASVDDMGEIIEKGESLSPVERMDAMADHTARRAEALKSVAKTAKPLYDSLDDTQKHRFDLLGRNMITAGRGPVWENEGGDAGGSWVPRNWDE